MDGYLNKLSEQLTPIANAVPVDDPELLDVLLGELSEEELKLTVRRARNRIGSAERLYALIAEDAGRVVSEAHEFWRSVDEDAQAAILGCSSTLLALGAYYVLELAQLIDDAPEKEEVKPAAPENPVALSQRKQALERQVSVTAGKRRQALHKARQLHRGAVELLAEVMNWPLPNRVSPIRTPSEVSWALDNMAGRIEKYTKPRVLKLRAELLGLDDAFVATLRRAGEDVLNTDVDASAAQRELAAYEDEMLARRRLPPLEEEEEDDDPHTEGLIRGAGIAMKLAELITIAFNRSHTIDKKVPRMRMLYGQNGRQRPRKRRARFMERRRRASAPPFRPGATPPTKPS